MPDPLMFATEAERLAAREQYVAIRKELHRLDGTDPSEFGPCIAADFDRAFPPIAPPKMDAFDAWLEVDDNGESYGQLHFSELPPMPTRNGRRMARVRVEEVDDE